ncbi:MAG: ABC transporter substrate-binding protein [Candidatus Limnocylindrus sp.]
MKNLRIGAIGAALLMVAAACGGSSSSSADTIAFAPKAYPEAGPADCADGYGFKRITSTDASTVVFELCAPDVAFIQKLALTNYQINDSGYLTAATADGSIVTAPNGTGPYKLKAWEKGSQIVLERNADYWGQLATSGTAVFQWQSEGAARLLALQAGTADGIDNLAPTDIAGASADPALQVIPRAALNTMYLGMNSGIAGDPFEKLEVRKAVALALDRQRIIDNFYPGGSEVASHFTPCSIEYACEGEAWYDQDLAAAKQLLKDAGYANGFKTKLSYRDVVRGYLPVPGTVATDIQAQLKEIGIDVTIEVVESTAFLDAASAGTLQGLHLLGWGADYPDPTNFLDYHFGKNSSPQFGAPIAAVYEPLMAAGSTADPAVRAAKYAEANNALKANIPMIPVAHGGSALAFKADITGAHSSPLGNEELSVMSSGGDDTFVWIQNGEPGGLYCADETDGESLRVCGQIGEGLYGFVTGEAATKPLLATACTASEDLLTWTCTLRTGVKFHNGATFDATDVVDSFASMWDCAHPLHKGRTSVFEYFSLISGFLNTDSCTKPAE